MARRHIATPKSLCPKTIVGQGLAANRRSAPLRFIGWLLAFLLIHAPFVEPASAADEIHWTIMGQTSVTFDWRGPETTIHYGLTAAYGQSASATTPNPLPWSSAGPFWEARISGLQENTVYHYRIGSGPDHTFRTPPPRGTSDFTVFVEGDIGDVGYYWRVADVQALIAAGDPDFCLMTGDLTYGNDHGPAAVDQHFNDVMVWSQDAAYMPAWGNHDWEPADDLRNYKGRFDLPNAQTSPGSPVSGGEDWYWFDYGNARFIAYPEPWTGAWSDWRNKATVLMDEAQADAAITFIVTFGHRPAYSSGHHGGHSTLKSYLDALGATHSKYVLNLNSHSHNYERTHPQSGVVHITTGIGGATLEQENSGCLWAGGCPPPAWSAFRAMHHGAVKLRFTASGIEGTAVCGPPGDNGSNKNDVTCSPGDAMDTFVIGSPGPPPNGAPVVTAPGSVSQLLNTLITVSVNASDPEGDPISSLTADLSRLPAGHDAVFSTSADNKSGLLTWTPSAGHVGGPYDVTFTAANELSGSATTSITVETPPPPPEANLVGNPSFESSTSGWKSFGEKVHLTRVSGGHDGAFAVEVKSDKDKPFGIHDDPNWVTPVAGAGETYRFTAWVRSARHEQTARIEVREFLGGSQQGGTAYSPTVTLSSSWQEMTVDFETLTGGSTLDFSLSYTPNKKKEAFQVDDVLMYHLSGEPQNQPPSAHLTLTPSTGPAPLMVLADASGSADFDGSITSYRFDFGDGTVVGPQPLAGASHSFGVGSWPITLTVVDDSGASASTSATVSIGSGGGETLGPNLVANPSFEQSTSGWIAYGGSTIARVGGGVDGAFALEMTGSGTSEEYGVNDSPTVLSSAPAVGTRYRFEAWVRSEVSNDVARLRVREYDNGVLLALAHSNSVTLTPSWQKVALDHITLATGSFVDLQVLSTPSGGAQNYQVDNISVRTVSGGSLVSVPDNPHANGLTAFVTPNPSRSGFVLSFVTPRAGPVRVRIYDASGRSVRAWANELSAGRHDLSFDGRDQIGDKLRAGVYFYRVKAGGQAAGGRFVILE